MQKGLETSLWEGWGEGLGCLVRRQESSGTDHCLQMSTGACGRWAGCVLVDLGGRAGARGSMEDALGLGDMTAPAHACWLLTTNLQALRQVSSARSCLFPVTTLPSSWCSGPQFTDEDIEAQRG